MKKILAAILFCCFCLGVMGFSACKRSGQQEKPISSSGEESNISDSSSGEHEYGELIAEIPATCEEEGIKAHYHCNHCGKDFDEDKQLLEDLVIPALGHDWGEPEYIFAEDGSICTAEKICKRDAAHKETATATISHEVTKEATCTEKGETTYTATFEEDWAEEQILKVEDIAELGHNYGDLIAEKSATCEEEGVKEHYHCDRCGKDFDKDKRPLEDLVIPALGHNYGELIEEVPATKTKEGIKAHYHCDRCGKNFDEEKHLLEDLVIPADSHIVVPEVGEIMTFGNYNGATEWIVLAKDEDKTLIIAKDIIDSKPYNTEYVDITWENCTLRSWLNSEYINTAFTEEERNSILTTHVVNDDNPSLGTEGGNDTEDKVFILSEEEARTYFANDEDMKAQGTQYAKDNGLYVYTGTDYPQWYGNSYWWLRLPGGKSDFAAHVYDNGHLNYYGTFVDRDSCGVRPALWVDFVHNWDEGSITQEPTCTENGTRTYTCTVCGKIRNEMIPPLGHKWGEGEVTKAATCTENGTRTYTCIVCGKIRNEMIPPLGHKWDEGEVTKAATCTENGTTKYTCTVCGATTEEIIQAPGHNYANWIPEVPATETKPGTKGHYHCDRCGQDFNALYNVLEDLAIPAGSQTAIPEVGGVITFGNYNGATEWIVLAKDEEKTLIIAKDIIDSKPYNTAYVDITWEKCTLRSWLNNGYINAAFTEEERDRILTTHVVNKDNESVPGGNDTEDKVFLLSLEEANTYFANDAARMAKGTEYAKGNNLYVYEGYSCWWLRSPGDYSDYATLVNYGGIFDYGYNVDYGYCGVRPALWISNQLSHNHSWDEGVVTKEPTCTEKGLKTYTCTVCKETKTEEIPALGHNYGELIAEQPATCEEEGVKAHYHCDCCGKDFDEDKQMLEDLVIPALGHDWGEPEYIFAEDGSTCTAERICKMDAAHKETATATISHEITKEATCTEKGETTYTATFEEDWAEEQILKVEDIAERGHNYGELIAEKPATCEEEGVKEHYHCDRCEKNFDKDKQPLEDLVIPVLGHNYGDLIAETPSTCEEEGVKAHYHCDRCGKDFDEAKQLLEDLVIPALGHNYGDLIAEIPATCEEEGVKAHYHCNRCEKDFDKDKQMLKNLVIPALGHDYGEWIAEVPATETEPGTKGHYHCSRCNKDFGVFYNILSNLVIPAGSQAVIPEVGETMIFGNYHEATEWIVLAKDEEKTLIIAKDIIDTKPYSTEYVSITWENCTLRAWLNNEYINEAFSEEERNRILTTHVINKDNPDRGTEGGNDTDDKVFLLSIEEVNRYFADDAARRAKGTDYAKGNGLYVHHEEGSAFEGYSCWWLRSPGDSSSNATNVYSDGGVNYYDSVALSGCGVRPALYIDNHNWDEGVITKQSTCTETGLRTYTCTVCGKTRTEEVPVLGHDYGEWIEKIPATEETEGTKGHYHCSRCGKDFDAEYKVLESLVIPKIPEIGETMIFGNYHGATEWIVLAKDEEKTLILAKDIIDSIPYNQQRVDITWENCTLRAWLNNEYINTAFSAEEKNRIHTTHVVNKDNGNVPVGNDTEDKVFILSIEEAQNYFADDAARMAKGTDYAKGQGLWVEPSGGYSYWWLRFARYISDDAARVSYGGTLDIYYVDVSGCGVRPALWISNQ